MHPASEPSAADYQGVGDERKRQDRGIKEGRDKQSAAAHLSDKRGQPKRQFHLLHVAANPR